MQELNISYRTELSQWQKLCDKNNKGRHLYQMQQQVGEERSLGEVGQKSVWLLEYDWDIQDKNSSLHLTGKHPSGNCDLCNQMETADHFILLCPKYTRERQKLGNGQEL